MTLIAVVTDEDGDDIAFSWSALSGTFDVTDNDTVMWTAPDDVGIVTINLEVNDGINLTAGTRNVGVEVYVPSVQPYYVGVATCVCHSALQTSFGASNHATARDRKLADPVGSHNFSAACGDACHTVGFDTTIDNGGFDENPIPELANIQCESCHGPASDHIAGPSSTNITVSNSVELCMTCHPANNEHHPHYDEWATSGHAVGATMDTTAAGWHYGGSCARCHTGVGFIEYIETGGTNTVPIEEATPVNCMACHDPHNGNNDHLIRELDEATMAGGDVVTDGGYGILCMNCHTGRRDKAAVISQVTNGYSRGLGPHHGNQGAFLNPDVFYDVWDGAFTWSSTNHLYMEESCVTCHVAEGHTFEPAVEACESCHGVLTDFDDIMAKEDFDGDGTIEGTQSEVTGLLSGLLTAIYATGVDTTGGVDLNDAVAEADTAAIWAPVLANGYTQIEVRGAVWNYLAVDYDHSHGVHNFAFTVQLLQQSYKFLTGNDVTGAYMLMPGER